MSDAPLLETPERTVGLLINAPAVFARADFVAWLDGPENRTMSWRRKGEPVEEYSDVVVIVDSHYEGTDSDMPEDVWRAICDAVYDRYGGPDLRLAGDCAVHVRLTNLQV